MSIQVRFLRAVLGNDLYQSKRILNNGTNINLRLNDRKETALMVAAGYKKVAIVRYLLKQGANVHLLDRNNNTVLHHATFNRDRERRHDSTPNQKTAIVRLLLKHRARVNLKDNNGKTASMYATQRMKMLHIKKSLIIHLLKKSGAQ